MILNKETRFRRDPDNKRLIVEREFDASLKNVWRAWTEKELLDQWWAPKPFKAVTKEMDFREGGRWLYRMTGPDGSGEWCLVDFKKIDNHKSFTSLGAFCDENGNINKDFPAMNWKNVFSSIGSATKVEVEISFSSVAELEKILEMGLEEGFSAALVNLDELLAK